MTRMRSPGVKLVQRSVKRANGTVDRYWQLRWPYSTGKTRSENIGRMDQMTAADAADERRKKIADLDNGKAVRDRTRLTLAEYLELDRDSIRSDVKASTLRKHKQVSEQVIEAIGGETCRSRSSRGSTSSGSKRGSTPSTS